MDTFSEIVRRLYQESKVDSRKLSTKFMFDIFVKDVLKQLNESSALRTRILNAAMEGHESLVTNITVSEFNKQGQHYIINQLHKFTKGTDFSFSTTKLSYLEYTNHVLVISWEHRRPFSWLLKSNIKVK